MDHAKELRKLADHGFCSKDGYSKHGLMLNEVAAEIDRLKSFESEANQLLKQTKSRGQKS